MLCAVSEMFMMYVCHMVKVRCEAASDPGTVTQPGANYFGLGGQMVALMKQTQSI